MIKIGFIGLGVMGAPIAGHLANAGHEVTIFNRTGHKADQWLRKYRGQKADTPAMAAKNADIIFTCVGNDDDLREVVLAGSEAAASTMQPGSVLIDHTTTSAVVAQEVSQHLRAQGCHFVDAPVSGGQSGADNGVLTIMCGGSTDVFDSVRSILELYSKRVRLMGPVGNGQLTKMVNQICVAGLLQGLAEGVHFAQCAQLDIEKVFEVISQGAAQSWQMDNRSKTMMLDQYDFGFAVDWMRKDLGICLETAREKHAMLPVTALVDQFYGEIQSIHHGGRWDTSSLLRRLQGKAES